MDASYAAAALGAQITNPTGKNLNNQKSITLRSGVSLLVGVIIGSGIFSSPGFVTQYVKSPGATICVWVACGVVSMLGGFCYSELGAALPFTGGDTVYLERAFGRMSAFLYVWVSSTVARPAGVALSAIVFSDYSCSVRWENGDMPDNARSGVALGAIAFICMLQMINLQLSNYVTSVLTFVKVVLVATLCIVGLYDVLVRQNDTKQLHPSTAFKGTTDSPGDWVLAVANCLYAYNGWNLLNITAAEVKNPAKVIPRAIVIALLVSMVSFVWINVAYMMTLDIADVSGSQTVAIDFTNIIFGDTMTTIVTVGIALAAFGTCHASMFAGSQAIRESGRTLMMPRFFSGQLQLCSDQSPTPAVGLLVNAVGAASMIAALDSFETIVKVYVWTQWVFYCLAVMALVSLRWMEPELDRPYRVWVLVPVVFVSISVFMSFVLFFISPGTCSIALIALLLGIPVYWLHQRYLKQQGLMSKTDEEIDSVPLLITQEGSGQSSS